MSTLEIVAAIFGFLCVYFLIQRNPWSWPTGLVQVILFVFVFAQARLYADMVLHMVYVFLQFYGWHTWLSSMRRISDSNDKFHATQVTVRRLSISGLFISVAVTVLLTLLFNWILRRYTDAVSPNVDSLVAAASLVAQFLLAWRYIENWAFWIFVDTLGIWLFASRELIPTAILYVLFGVMATVGLLTWMKSYRCAVAVQAEL